MLNGAIANVALPAIARDLHTDPATSIWVVNAFQLAVTVSLLPLASLGEIHGYRKVYRWGLVVFTIASVFCALSSTLPVLILARVAQGVGAAGIMSVNGALIRFIYPRRSLGQGRRTERDDRIRRLGGRAIGGLGGARRSGPGRGCSR